MYVLAFTRTGHTRLPHKAIKPRHRTHSDSLFVSL
jgi:hypothetical protein